MAKKQISGNMASMVAACKEPESVDTRDFLGRMGDKWSILIIVVLANMPKRRARFSELKNGIDGISQTMLTSTLRSLERDGIVIREIFPEVPPRVEYELTPFGAGVLEPLKLLVGWVVKNWGEVKKSRNKYDREKNAN